MSQFGTLILIDRINATFLFGYKDAEFTEEKLLGQLEEGYQKGISPLNPRYKREGNEIVRRDNNVINVDIFLELISINNIDLAGSLMDVTFEIHSSWFDRRLVWFPEEYDLIQRMSLCNQCFWKPKLEISNVDRWINTGRMRESKAIVSAPTSRLKIALIAA